jgi:ABC-2 type transport system ATP-binding protein
MFALETKDLSRSFGTLKAVEKLTLKVSEGEMFGLLGPNGAGKTTTVRMLACLISPTSGSASILGNPISTAQDKIRSLIGLLPESPGLYKNMSAYDNLDFYAKLYGISEAQRNKNIEKYLRLLEIWDRKDDDVGGFSKGMAQKVAIARALIHEPKILFLDEPTSGLDPKASKIVNDSLLALKEEKITIFLNTHNLYQAQNLCDRVAIIKSKVVAEGEPKKLAQSLWGQEIEIVLEKKTEKIITAVNAMKSVKKMREEGYSIFIEPKEAGKDNPDIINAVVKAGGRIKFVRENTHSLDDVYMELMDEK